MSKNYYLAFICLIVSFSSCANLNDSWVDLGDNYTYKTDADFRSISSNQSYHNTHIYSQVIDYKFDDKFIIAKQKPDYEHYKMFEGSNLGVRYRIYSDFIKDSTSKTFIDETNPFIRQAIRADKSLYHLLKSKGVTDQNEIEDMDKIGIVLDSVFQADPFYLRLFSSTENYWLINKEKNIRYGPFTKKEFDYECSQQNVKLTFD